MELFFGSPQMVIRETAEVVQYATRLPCEMDPMCTSLAARMMQLHDLVLVAPVNGPWSACASEVRSKFSSFVF